VLAIRAVFLFFFGGIFAASAQPVNPCTRIHVPRTAVTLFTTTDLSSKTAAEGEEIQLRVDTEIRIDDCLLIAKGANARGRITTVQKQRALAVRESSRSVSKAFKPPAQRRMPDHWGSPQYMALVALNYLRGWVFSLRRSCFHYRGSKR
jgi:hypothetical protein